MSKCEHGRKYPCSQCTNRLLHLLQARVPGTNLWQCDIDAIRSAVRGHPDFTACVHCGKGSTFYDPVERCTCKGGKTTLVHVAESRTDSGAQWQDEDVVDSKGRLFKGALPCQSGPRPRWGECGRARRSEALGRVSCLPTPAARCCCASRCTCVCESAPLPARAEGASWRCCVADSSHALPAGSDPSWQRNCPFGASKESLMMLNLIKSAARQ